MLRRKHGFGVSARFNVPNSESFVLAVDCSAKFRCLKRCSGRTRLASDMVSTFDPIFSSNIILRANIIARRHYVGSRLSSRSSSPCEDLAVVAIHLGYITPCWLTWMECMLCFGLSLPPLRLEHCNPYQGVCTELPYRDTYHGLVTELSKDVLSCLIQ
jgi:hypothetical protein